MSTLLRKISLKSRYLGILGIENCHRNIIYYFDLLGKILTTEHSISNKEASTSKNVPVIETYFMVFCKHMMVPKGEEPQTPKKNNCISCTICPEVSLLQ